MIKAIYFDIGNTLFLYNYDFLRGMLEERYNVDVTNEELEATHHIVQKMPYDPSLPHHVVSDELYRQWFKSLGIEQGKVEDIINAIRHHPFSHLFWAKTEDGTRDTLNWFHDRGFRLGVISNAEGQIKRLVEHAKLDELFDTIIDSHNVGFQKPEEGIFRRALSDLNIKPEEAVHVGDIFETDVVGARSVGITPILVDRFGRYPNVSCIKVKSVSELKELPLFK